MNRIDAVIRQLRPRLLAPVDIASLVFFRIAFGTLMAFEIGRFFQHDWIERHYIKPAFHFRYYGFEWIDVLPGRGMVHLFAALAVLALCIVAGFKYRLATALFFLGFTYVFLLDQTWYLNHFYLICLVTFLLIFVPAHRSFSIDARRDPMIRSRTVPAWALWILRAEFTIMYVYGGIAKIDPDWLRGAPMRGMLAAHSSLPWVGPYLTDARVVMLFAYGGLLFDLFIVPLLLWPKTRYFALAWAAAFHGMNNTLFQIGIFPFFAMAGTLLFLPPDWPRRLFARFRRTSPEKARKRAGPSFSRPAVAVLSAFFAIQLLFPLRHFLYPGNANWTGEGQHFSWRMMLREHHGTGRFVAIDRFTGQQLAIFPLRHLDREQVEVMWTEPDMILQFAHYIAQQLRAQGWQVVEIRATSHASLNGRRMQTLIDPSVNLAAEKRGVLRAKWIMPLTEPLPRR